MILASIAQTLFQKWADTGLFLFIFFLFKQKIYRKTVGVSGIRTRMVGKSQHIIATLQFDILAL